jgi:hypothetical protein
MGKKFKVASIKPQAGRGVGCFAMAVFMLMVTAQPAHAQTATLPEQIVQMGELVAIYGQQVLTYVQAELQGAQTIIEGALNNAGQALQVQAAGKIAEAGFKNERLNTLVQTDQNTAVAHARPTNYSPCHVAQALATASNNELAGDAMTQALTQAFQNSLADPAVNAQRIITECKLGFASLDTSTAEGRANAALCPAGSSSANAYMDSSDAAVTGYLQYLVDPLFANTMKANGVYTPMTTVSGPQYYPFVAAATFCMNAIPLQCNPPDAIVGGVATIDLLKMPNYRRARQQIGFAARACFKALSRRMQFDSNDKSPANNPRSGITTRHDEQVVQCIEEHDAGDIDDSTLADCRNNGRSELQAEHDKAYGRGMGSTHTMVESTKETQTASQITASQKQMETAFKVGLEAERNTLGTAMVSALSVPGVCSGATSQTIK